jgi:hypothetical protein
MKYLLAIAALALAGATTVALAQPKPPPAATPPPAFHGAERKAPAPHMVFLSPSGEPFRQGPNTPDPLKAWFEQADIGHLGYLDKAEFRADAVRFFKKLDANGSGIVDGFEVQDYETKLVPELAEWDNGDYPGEFGAARPGAGQGGGQAPGGGQYPGGGHGGRGGQGRGGQGQSASGAQTASAPAAKPTGRARAIQQLIYEPEPVSGADFNLDSHITLDEWMRATDQRFDLLDPDHTGRLTLDALRARLNNPPKAPRTR